MMSLYSQPVGLSPCQPVTAAPVWQRCVISIVAGVMGLEILGLGIGQSAPAAIAQVILDGSLGIGGTLTGPNYIIQESYGVVVDQNLFHSFWQFNLPNVGDSASFLSSPGIRNVLARVTGVTESYINGQINAGAVNLFLINPNGIIFGPNSSLNVGGSFIASTLDTVTWPNGQFSASNFANPANTPLNFVGDPSGFLASLQTPGPVATGFEQLPTGYTLSTTDTNLFVPDGQNLGLIGGDVLLNKTYVKANGGRIELAAVSPGGTIDLSYSSQGVPIIGQPSNIVGTNLYSLGSYLDVSAIGSDAGTIQLQAGSINLGSTTLDAGSFIGGSGTSGFAGHLFLTGWEQITIRDNSRLYADSTSDDFGNWGRISIAALNGSVSLDNSRIDTQNQGLAYAGDILISGWDQVNILNNSEILSTGNNGRILIGENTIFGVTVSPSVVNIERSTISTDLKNPSSSSSTAGIIQITGLDQVLITASKIQSTVDSGIDGSAGTITLGALSGNLSLNSVNLSTTNNGTGVAGKIDLTGQNVAIANSDITSRSDNNLYAFGMVDLTATGGSLTLSNTLVSTTNLGTGFAGDISLIARDQVVLVNQTNVYSQGNFGRIFVGTGLYSSITPNSVVIDRSTVQTNSLGTDFAGDIAINATNQVAILNNSQIFSQGNQGRIFIGASQFSPVSPQTLTISHAELNTVNADPGQAGDISLVAANQLFITNSRIFSDTAGVANAGEITARAGGNLAIANSQLTSSVQTGATGNGGTINLYGNSITLNTSAQVKTSTAGTGNAGNINVYAVNHFNLDGAGTGLFATTEPGSTGTSGSIFVDPIAVTLTNGAGISVNSQGRGNGGNLTLYAGRLTLNNGAFLTAATASGQGGNITLLIQNLLLLRQGSLISATAGGTGNGGNINLAAQFVVAVPEENTDIIANAVQGNGGKINISTQGLFGIAFRPRLTLLSDITASSDFGLQGTVAINTPDVDVQSALAQLAANFVNPDQLVAGSCIARRTVSQGSFVVTGTGGLPTTPYDQGISDRYEVMGIQGGAIAHTPTVPSTPPATPAPQAVPSAILPIWKPGDPVNEARGISLTTDGRKLLGSWEQVRAIASPDQLICQ